MFGKLGSFVVRFRILIVVFWIIAAAAMFLFAPSLSSTGSMNQSGFLPKGTESQKAGELISKYFPGAGSGSSGTLVFYNPKGLGDADLAYAQTVQDWLLNGAKDFQVTNVTSVFNSPEAAARLMSPDKTTMLMNVGLTSTTVGSQTGKSVDAMREYVKGAPAGLEVYVSGAAGIYSDLFSSLGKSMDMTTIITVALVIVLLLIIYRSPVASLVPLFTIGIAYLVSRGTLGLIAQAGVNIWSQIDVFLIVLVFGAGTDYCLFIVSRFREELRRNETRTAAIKATVGRIGAVITASAFAVIIGLSGMAVARYQMVKTMGPVMGVAILITLIASLTLTPALASLLGNKLFWPAHADVKNGNHKTGPGFWGKVARVTTGHPAITAAVVLVLMGVPFLALPGYSRSYDQLSELPAKSDSVAGFRVLQNHFNVGEMDPLTVVMVAPDGQRMTSPEGLAAMIKLGNDLRATKGIAQAQSIVQPYGTSEIPATLTVSGQLGVMVKALSGGGSGAGGTSTTAGSTAAIAQGITQLGAYLTELGNSFAWVKQDATYLAIVKSVSGIQAAMLSMQSGTLPPAQAAQAAAQLQAQMATFAQQVGELAGKFKAAGDPCFLPSSLSSDKQMAAALQLFFSKDGQASRMYVILGSMPQSNEALTTVADARKVITADLAGSSFKGYQAAIAGSTASLADVRDILNNDFNKVQIVVIAGVFVIFVLLLRSLVAPLYLLATVLLSYGATLSLVSWIFQGLLKQDGISFIVPIIIFVLLVALGADYNIFLMSRVREESEIKPTREATQTAAGATGAVITACGIILAGTFAALIFSPLRIMVQVGTAVAIGILIDTFVVRSLLVPAIATLLGRANWWPSRLGAKAKRQ